METLGGVSAMSHYHSNNHTETSKFTTCTTLNNSFKEQQYSSLEDYIETSYNASV